MKRTKTPPKAKAETAADLCPKCKTPARCFWELSTASTGFHRCDDGTVRPNGDNDNEDIYGVRALCDDCGKEWRVKGAIAIFDIPGYPPPHVHSADCSCGNAKGAK